MPEQITVLQVIPRMQAGGAELGCLQITQALVNAGHRALVVSAGGQHTVRLYCRSPGRSNLRLHNLADPPVEREDCSQSRRLWCD